MRNMTFVVKYMSVSARGRTARVATSVSCFGGLGQLYRVKVWAVSGPNISRQPAVKCFTPHGQCREEGGRCTRYTIVLLTMIYVGMLISKEATMENILYVGFIVIQHAHCMMICTYVLYTDWHSQSGNVATAAGGQGPLPSPTTVAITSVNTYMTLSTPSGMSTFSPELMDSKSDG